MDEIIAYKRMELERLRHERPLAQVQKAAERADGTRDFRAALKKTGSFPAVIAEIKKASPSRGVLRGDFHPAEIARSYAEGGAAALSVLTDEKFFQGSLEHLREVRDACDLPVLRKDFMIDEYQIWEARAAGADAVLLIAGVLTPDDLNALLFLVGELGMAALVETHTEEDVNEAVQCGADIIGINNRDLRTFRVDMGTTLRLLPIIPGDRVIVSESGIRTREQVLLLKEKGVDAVLIGEALMLDKNPGARLREFT